MGLIFSGVANEASAQKKNREPVVSGSFYPGNASKLTESLNSFFEMVTDTADGNKIRALVVPHAGYAYSGQVAAWGYSRINPKETYSNIFIIASSHHVNMGKASVYNIGNYISPLGEVHVNLDIATKLIKENNCFTFDPSAHSREHSIEVQLPFIQHHFKTLMPIVPIVLGTQNRETIREISNVLKPYFNEENLFIISADFSHYPEYEQAIKVDRITADAFCTGDPEIFLSAIKSNAEKKIPGLVTSMCAWPAGLCLLYLAEDKRELEFEKIIYRNSGDSKQLSQRSEVVGYNAISLREKNLNNEFYLSSSEKSELLRIARETLESYTNTHKKIKLINEFPGLEVQTGAFVSLKKEGKLRGCIGTFKPDAPLFKLIQSLTIASATEDTRFLPVQKKELKDIEIEISVLTPMKKIQDPGEIILGKHGIYIRKNGRSGTFLPQVASETGWTLEEFLGHCARDKAGLEWDDWKTSEIFIYEAIVFKE